MTKHKETTERSTQEKGEQRRKEEDRGEEEEGGGGSKAGYILPYVSIPGYGGEIRKIARSTFDREVRFKE